MRESLDTARLIDWVIAITVLEGCALLVYRQCTGKGIALRDFAVNMVSGLCLMLALRCLAVGAGTGWIVGSLVGAGAAHFTDIALRWRRGRAAAPSSAHGVVA